MLYRRKPIEVEAFQVTEEMCWQIYALPEWVRPRAGRYVTNGRTHLDTPRGHIHLFIGDFVVRCKSDTPIVYHADEFAEQFEQVGERT